MKLTRHLLTLLLVGTLAACATTGVKIDQAKIDALQKGKTTYSEIVRDWGDPTNTMVGADGTKTLMYMYSSYQSTAATFIPVVGAFAGGANTQQSNVTLNFDKRGVLKDFTTSNGTQKINNGL